MKRTFMLDLAPFIDHTLLKPTARQEEIHQLCDEARRFHFAGVCVPPPFVTQARDWIAGSGLQLVTVIGFPFGYSAPAAKMKEVEIAMADGASELDVVMNQIDCKAGQWARLESEMKMIIRLVHEQEKKLKVIIESGVLTDVEIIRCCQLYAGLGVDYLKTSTGYAERSASVEAVRLMKAHLPGNVLIKASGGIRNAGFARQLIEAGASRLGCSSSVALVTEVATQGPAAY